MESQSEIARFVTWYYLSLAIVAPAIMAAVSCAARRRSEVLHRALASEDLRLIGSLVDSLEEGSRGVQRQCKEALIRLLPRLTEQHSHLLDEYRQARLRYVVMPPASPIYSTRLALISRSSPQSVALRVAIIRALSHVGDHEALTMFDELMECTPTNSADRRIRQAIFESRPALAARVMREPARISLLRPATYLEEESLVRIPRIEMKVSEANLLRVSDDR